jgi:hypothetical protein
MSPNDKNRRKYRVVFFVLAFALYCGFCLRFVIVKPPIQFDELVDLPAQNAITDWYEKTSRVPGHPIDLNSVLYALGHPADPFRFHPGVSLDGLGGKGSLNLSFGPYVAVFRDEEAGVRFDWDDSAD